RGSSSARPRGNSGVVRSRILSLPGSPRELELDRKSRDLRQLRPDMLLDPFGDPLARERRIPAALPIRLVARKLAEQVDGNREVVQFAQLVLELAQSALVRFYRRPLVDVIVEVAEKLEGV